MGPLFVAAIFAVGYLYSYLDPVWQYKVNRTEGYRLYFVVGLVGSFAFLFSLLIILLIDHFNLAVTVLNDSGIEMTQVVAITGAKEDELKYYSTIPIAFVFSFGLGLVRRVYFYFSPGAMNKVIRNLSLSNAFEYTLFESTLDYKTVAITLDNNKVYIGLVQKFYPIAGRLEYLPIIPVLSGYRDANTFSMKFTTNYYQHYEEFFDNKTGTYVINPTKKLEDFVVVIPVEKIQTLSHFDIESFKHFKASNFEGYEQGKGI